MTKMLMDNIYCKLRCQEPFNAFLTYYTIYSLLESYKKKYYFILILQMKKLWQ